LEKCAIASLDYVEDVVWGWMNVNCSSKYVAICRLQVPALQPQYINPSNNHTYLLNTSQSDWGTAEALCQAGGGHLASYSSMEEQVQLESHYINGGYLFPAYHVAYWIGLVSTNATWPKFIWLDGSSTLHSKGYLAWGTYMPGSNPEPNNFPAPPEYCGVANASEPMIGTWGWADANCRSTKASFLCESFPMGPYNYTSNMTNATYVLNTQPALFNDAETYCTDHGGHLVSYVSLAEQQDVEGYFVRTGTLVPGYHGSYCIGLRAATRPYFNWLEASALSPWKLDGAWAKGGGAGSWRRGAAPGCPAN
jgi:hypothetical protein